MTMKTKMNNMNNNHPNNRPDQEDGLHVALKVTYDVFKYYICSNFNVKHFYVINIEIFLLFFN